MAIQEAKKQGALGADEIRRLIPQRFPMLLLDKVVELVPGRHAVGIKSVSVNEPYFQGHFPEQAVLPGVFLIEVAAQLAAVLIAVGSATAMRPGYLAAVREFKFIEPVVPGDRLVIRVHSLVEQGAMTRVNAEVLRDGAPAATGVLWLTYGREANGGTP
jgi:3-hydroxyacyl-[acyl-carrier-protein] dehydratase